MKTLTIQQPYATLIAEGEKWIENRTWETSLRGPLLIHAGKGTAYLAPDELAQHVTGAAIAIVEEIACYELELIKRNALRAPKEKALGTGRTWSQLARHKHAEGPVCWVLRNVIKLPEPIPMKGAQGLFNAPDEVRAKLKEMGIIR